MTTPRRAMPADFAERSLTMTPHALTCHYRTSPRIVVRWFNTLRNPEAIEPPRPKLRPMPAGFRDLAMVSTIEAMEVNLGVSNYLVARWLGELSPTDRAARKAAIGRMTKPGRKLGRGSSLLAKFDSDTQNRTFADLAAMHLQSRRFVPVCRATIYGKQFAGLWQVGRLKMPESDMVALARKQGWAA